METEGLGYRVTEVTQVTGELSLCIESNGREKLVATEPQATKPVTLYSIKPTLFNQPYLIKPTLLTQSLLTGMDYSQDEKIP